MKVKSGGANWWVDIIGTLMIAFHDSREIEKQNTCGVIPFSCKLQSWNIYKIGHWLLFVIFVILNFSKINNLSGIQTWINRAEGEHVIK